MHDVLGRYALARCHSKSMSLDPEKTSTVIETLRAKSARELAVTVILVVGAVSISFWIENRYAKIEETRASIERTEIEIRKHKEEIIQMHVRTLELIKLQPPAVQDSIDRNSKAFMENYRRLESSMNTHR